MTASLLANLPAATLKAPMLAIHAALLDVPESMSVFVQRSMCVHCACGYRKLLAKLKAVLSESCPVL